MWIYSQTSGELWSPEGKILATGYSGYEEGKNNPMMEDRPYFGPIPKGMWVVGEIYDSKRVGPYAIPLYESGHHAHGRTYFRIHGDSSKNPGKASKGCVIFPSHIRQMVYESGDRIFQVIE